MSLRLNKLDFNEKLQIKNQIQYFGSFFIDIAIDINSKVSLSSTSKKKNYNIGRGCPLKMYNI